ncbi:hypothetical protein [Streptomyces sp. NPDC054887]
MREGEGAVREWVDPRYAEAVEVYRAWKAMAGPSPKRGRGRAGKSYGDPFVVVVHPATRKPYALGR